MGLVIGQLPRLPDELVNNSWVKELDVSNQDNSQQDNFVGMKLEGLKPGQILDTLISAKPYRLILCLVRTFSTIWIVPLL